MLLYYGFCWNLIYKSMSENQITTLGSAFFKERHGLLAYLHFLCRDPHLAEDMLQEVWVCLMNKIQQGEEIQNLSAWCRGTARNLMLHHWRSRHSNKVIADSELLDLVDMAFAENENSSEDDLAKHRREALAHCLKTVPEKSRTILALKYEQGLSAKHIAEKLDKTQAGILMSLSRIRRSLEQCIHRRLSVTP